MFHSMLKYPIIQAPMAGGASTPALAAAVSNAGGLGFLAAGYKTAAKMRKEIKETNRLTDKPFGVNLFVPGREKADPEALSRFAENLKQTADELVTTLGEAKSSDDDWENKLEVLYELRVPVVSFTFGCPEADVIDKLKTHKIYTIVTVTTPQEAVTANQAGADAICLQGTEAGGHRASFDNHPENDQDYTALTLLRLVSEVIDLPLIAAGGIMHGKDIAAFLTGGASAVQLGTAFLRCPESGANPLHKSALVNPRFSGTTVTRAFTGRRARGLTNRFIREFGPMAPAAYPQLHYMTRDIRKAAARTGELEYMALWAGQGFRIAREIPAGKLVDILVTETNQAFAAAPRDF